MRQHAFRHIVVLQGVAVAEVSQTHSEVAHTDQLVVRLIFSLQAKHVALESELVILKTQIPAELRLTLAHADIELTTLLAQLPVLESQITTEF